MEKYVSKYNDIPNKKYILYDNITLFNITNLMPESNTFSVITPMCSFDEYYSRNDCKVYINMFLDLNCSLYQEKIILDHNGNPDYYLFLSPEYQYDYDARLNIYNQTNYSLVRLAPGLICQSNNLCVFIVNFRFSYKNWKNVPYTGNNVFLNCSKFAVFSHFF